MWSRVLGNGDVGVALYNKEAEDKDNTDITVDFKTQLNLVGAYNVRDIFLQEDMGSFDDSYTAKNVPVHGVAFLRLSKVG